MDKKFLALFSGFGFVLNNYEETFNVLNVDQRKFQSDVKKHLQDREDYLKYLITNLQNYLDDEINFLIALLPTRSNLETVVGHSSNQDNLLKLLIEIDQYIKNIDYIIDIFD